MLRELDSKDLANALRGAPKRVQQTVFRNISRRAGTFLKDDMDRKRPDDRMKRVLAVNRMDRIIEKPIEAGETRRGRATPSDRSRKRMAIAIDVHEATSARESFLAIARKAKADGLLSLEEDIDRVDDTFLRDGLQLVIDGTDSVLVERLLRNRLECFEQEGTMRIREATLRMERELAEDIRRKKMILDGVLSVQWGDNPQMLAQRLDSHRAES